MTKTQAEIIDLITKLPPAERIELVQHMRAAHLLDDTFYDRMTPEQRAHLAEGIAQADRGEGTEASIALDRIARRVGSPSA